MSFAEYEVLEHPFGWKVEYWDGHAHLTPREAGVHTRIDLLPRTISPNHALIPVHPTFTEQMIAGYFEVFLDSVEFCDWPVKEVQDSAEKCIHRYFAQTREQSLPASVIALEPDSDKLAGLALFVLKKENKPHLRLLYVRPEFQRKGIAAAMVGWGINTLIESNFQELFSTYHICNQDSRQWHHNFGFQDLYDSYYIRSKLAWFNQEIWRREKLELLEGLETLIQEREDWKSRFDPEDYLL